MFGTLFDNTFRLVHSYDDDDDDDEKKIYSPRPAWAKAGTLWVIDGYIYINERVQSVTARLL